MAVARALTKLTNMGAGFGRPAGAHLWAAPAQALDQPHANIRTESRAHAANINSPLERAVCSCYDQDVVLVEAGLPT